MDVSLIEALVDPDTLERFECEITFEWERTCTSTHVCRGGIPLTSLDIARMGAPTLPGGCCLDSVPELRDQLTDLWALGVRLDMCSTPTTFEELKTLAEWTADAPEFRAAAFKGLDQAWREHVTTVRQRARQSRAAQVGGTRWFALARQPRPVGDCGPLEALILIGGGTDKSVVQVPDQLVEQLPQSDQYYQVEEVRSGASDVLEAALSLWAPWEGSFADALELSERL